MPVIESARATHTTLETANVPRAMRFYKEVLGLRTHQVLEKAGHLIDTRGVYAAYIELPKLAPIWLPCMRLPEASPSRAVFD